MPTFTTNTSDTATDLLILPPMAAKPDILKKRCPCCGRHFTWRKKFAKVWGQMVYCSTTCKATQQMDNSPVAEPS